MSDQVWVDTDRMDVVTPQIELLKERTKAAHDTLLEGLAPLSNAAGEDDAGAKAFRASHDPTRDQILEAMNTFTKITDSVLDGVQTMRDIYTSTEQHNTVQNLGSSSNPPTDDHQAPKTPTKS